MDKDQLQQAYDNSRTALLKIDTHEEACEKQWQANNQRLEKIERKITWGNNTLILTLLTAIGFLIATFVVKP